MAQSEYDKIAWQSGIGATQQAVDLQQASADYESAKANYEALLRGATTEELDIARAAVEAARAQVDVAQAQARQAQAQLDQLLAGPTAETIAIALNGVLMIGAGISGGRAFQAGVLGEKLDAVLAPFMIPISLFSLVSVWLAYPLLEVRFVQSQQQSETRLSKAGVLVSRTEARHL